MSVFHIVQAADAIVVGADGECGYLETDAVTAGEQKVFELHDSLPLCLVAAGLAVLGLEEDGEVTRITVPQVAERLRRRLSGEGGLDPANYSVLAVALEAKRTLVEEFLGAAKGMGCIDETRVNEEAVWVVAGYDSGREEPAAFKIVARITAELEFEAECSQIGVRWYAEGSFTWSGVLQEPKEGQPMYAAHGLDAAVARLDATTASGIVTHWLRADCDLLKLRDPDFPAGEPFTIATVRPGSPVQWI